ncbi:MAG TPA: prephenate dehydrogenase/arogenate dehydrogenase family protein [Candidatus Acidoferrales bacterium]|nr:prephenate dehydrogenase/arogenate dehydrogenase family protein [Candidatus Acidoferrales bacterium]
MTGIPARSVAVIGFGRFGRLWASMLRDDCDLMVFDSDSAHREEAAAEGFSSVPLYTALAAEVVFYCVPISAFESTLREHALYFANLEGTRTLIDTLSVKVHPRTVFEQHLPEAYEALLTHPMFGPDSVAVGGLAGQIIVLDPHRMHDAAFAAWKEYFGSKGLSVVVMDADQHDRLAAESQGVTHFVGRTLERFGFEPTPIDTLGTRKLHEITAQVTNDTQQLFVDLQTRNPYTSAMRVRLSHAQDSVFDQLLPNRLVTDRLVVGIQGGRGSFNEEAARHYLRGYEDGHVELVYLHTTERVLRALHEGSVDRGQFAIHNSVGGMVGESVAAMARYRFDIVEEFEIKIAHALMMSSTGDPAAVDTVMTHPQVLAQCRSALASRYPNLRQTSGEGDLIDHAKVAEFIASGELAPNIATMGSSVLANIHGLRVIEDNLQDLGENFTSFLWVQRPGT